jgi:hypothetical protein
MVQGDNDILPTRTRLHTIRLTPNDLCPQCYVVMSVYSDQNVMWVYSDQNQQQVMHCNNSGKLKDRPIAQKIITVDFFKTSGINYPTTRRSNQKDLL